MKSYIKQFNALRITVFGDLEPVYIEDFSTSEGLGAAIGFGCNRINAVSTRELQHHSQIMDVSVVGFVDAHGYEKNHVPNRCLQAISGYDLLMGPGVLCGWENNDYAPLSTREVEIVADYFAAYLDIPKEKMDALVEYFRVPGQDEYDEGRKLSKEEKYDQAHAMFEKSWELGYADGLNALACDYLYGEGVPMDREKGHQLMEQAAEAGSIKAIRNIGAYSLSGNHGYPEDEKKARQYLQKAADQGDDQAMGWMAFMYSREWYGFKNTLKALYWAQKAMKKGNDLAWLVQAMVIAEDEYYPYQPRHVRYCLEKYMVLYGCTLEEALAMLQEEEKNEAIQAAEPLATDYPEIDREMFEASEADPYAQYLEAMNLLKAGKAQEGGELLLKAAQQGCHYAMSSVGWRCMDGGQGDEFSYDPDGSVTYFPANFRVAYQNMCAVAALGETDTLRLLPFSYQNFDKDIAKGMLIYYVELTGDTFAEQYILPNLEKVLELSDAGVETPEITGQELAELEQKLPGYTRAELTIPERIERLESAYWEGGHAGYGDSMAWRLSVDPEDSQALSWERNRKNRATIGKLLDIYHWIVKVQE